MGEIAFHMGEIGRVLRVGGAVRLEPGGDVALLVFRGELAGGEDQPLGDAGDRLAQLQHLLHPGVLDDLVAAGEGDGARAGQSAGQETAVQGEGAHSAAPSTVGETVPCVSTAPWVLMAKRPVMIERISLKKPAATTSKM